MTDLDLAVVGAGPQALTLLTHLAQVDGRDLSARVRVFDGQEWMASWDRQFDRFSIPMLRSSQVHHPHPEPQALRQFAQRAGRSTELSGPLGRPSTQLFADYCNNLVDALDLRDLRTDEHIAEIRPTQGGQIDLTTVNGARWRANRVVIATNPLRMSIPLWASQGWDNFGTDAGLLHSRDWSLEHLRKGPVVVVGGGLTAVQVVMAHTEVGDPVTWITRERLRVRHLDIDLSWLGRELTKFNSIPDFRTRALVAKKAPGGGSVPAAEEGQIGDLVQGGKVTHYRAPVDSVRHHNGALSVAVRLRGSMRTIESARVICATGSHTHSRFEPLLRHCKRQNRTRHSDGIPEINHDLSWPGTRIHVMGPLTLAQVGPACRTLIGARIAAQRILAAMDD